MAGGDSHDATRLASLEKWSAKATLLILAGIVGDIVLPFFFPHDTVSWSERWAQVACNALIGVGLAVEYVCIVRTIAATSALQAASDMRVAEAEARAAEAYQHAMEAKLELARLQTPRTLSAEQARLIGERLRQFGQIPFVFRSQAEPEPITFAEHLGKALAGAGWAWMAPNDAITLSSPERPSIGLGMTLGVSIQVTESRQAEWQPAAAALQVTLAEFGIAANIEDFSSADSLTVDAIHITVGTKP